MDTASPQNNSMESSRPEEKTQAKIVLPPENGDGMGVALSYVLSNGKLFMEFSMINKSQTPLSGFALQVNVNIVGLKLAGPLSVPNAISPGQSTIARVPLQFDAPPPNAPKSPHLQIGLKNNVKIYYFQDLIPFKYVFSSDG